MSTQQHPSTAPVIHPPLSSLDTPADPPAPVTDPPAPDPKDPLKNPTTTPSPVDPPPPPTDPKDIVVDPPPPDPGSDAGDDEPAPDDFWGEVTKLRGDDMKWEFPEGIDPITPAGVHHAIKVAADRELEIFEDNLMRADPRSYAYMLHRSKGGSDEEFFAEKTEVLPDWEVLKTSVDSQSAFYKRSLIRRGIQPEHADLIIKDAVDKNKITGLVESEYNSTKQQQEKQLADLLRINQANEQQYQQRVQKMAVALQDKILHNKDLGITIPDTKRPGFLQFVNSLVYHDQQTGKWFINQEMGPENMSQVLEALYYMHVGGNMSDIISNRANQQQVQKVKLRMQSDKTKKSTQPDPNNKPAAKPGVQTPISEL